MVDIEDMVDMEDTVADIWETGCWRILIVTMKKMMTTRF